MSPTKRTALYEDLKDRIRSGTRAVAGASIQPKAGLLDERKLSTVMEIPDDIRVLEILALADRVFGDEKKAEAWLSRPNKSLSGQVPSDLLRDALGAAVVRETLEQIDHGIFA